MGRSFDRRKAQRWIQAASTHAVFLVSNIDADDLAATLLGGEAEDFVEGFLLDAAFEHAAAHQYQVSMTKSSPSTLPTTTAIGPCSPDVSARRIVKPC